ncbi:MULTISPECIES: phage terminase small subunit P27 family [Bifidobacterium]|jgi:P27 family predicted phage terminase small subunit|nr:phage terminase small subunit P27 family [Bifidobacterium tibiigranuli]MCI1212091.1 phage terminase small subunit P27 family [Bifidobacterium tibiigranuli]
MGARGPQKAPLRLRVINGRADGRDSGGRRLEKPLEVAREAPKMPSWLPHYAKLEWKRVVPPLAAKGLLKEGDLGSLAAYCLAVWQMKEAMSELTENGSLTTPGKESLKAHPAVAALRNAQSTIRSFAHEFGLTPASEANVAGKDDEEDDGNPFAAQFG